MELRSNKLNLLGAAALVVTASGCATLTMANTTKVTLGEVNSSLSQFAGQEPYDQIQGQFEYATGSTSEMDPVFHRSAVLAASIKQLEGAIAWWQSKGRTIESKEEFAFFTAMAEASAGLPDMMDEAGKLLQKVATTDPTKNMSATQAVSSSSVSPRPQ